MDDSLQFRRKGTRTCRCCSMSTRFGHLSRDRSPKRQGTAVCTDKLLNPHHDVDTAK